MGILALPENRKTAFYKKSFNNWRKSVERFKVYEKSELHKEAVIKFPAWRRQL